MIAWVNGRLEDRPMVAAMDRGFTLGDGVFETIKAGAGQPLYLDRHLRRLRAACNVLCLEFAESDAVLLEAMQQVLSANHLTEAALRLSISRGVGARGLLPPVPSSPTIIITASPVPPPLPPACLVVAQGVRRNPYSPLSSIKSLSYLENILARMEAEKRGGDDAVMLNIFGRVSETTIANIFAMIDGAIVTPPVEEGVLPGIMRERVIEALPVIQRPIVLSEMMAAQEIVLTNSLSIRQVRSIDDHPIGMSGLYEAIQGLG